MRTNSASQGSGQTSRVRSREIQTQVEHLYAQNLSGSEIARQLGITRQAVSLRLQKIPGYNGAASLQTRRRIRDQQRLALLEPFFRQPPTNKVLVQRLGLSIASITPLMISSGLRAARHKRALEQRQARIQRYRAMAQKHRPNTVAEFAALLGEDPLVVGNFLRRNDNETLRMISRRPTRAELRDRRVRALAELQKNPDLTRTELAQRLSLNRESFGSWLRRNPDIHARVKNRLRHTV